MADRLFTSKQSEEILEKLSYTTKLEFITLCRIAFALSLKKYGKSVPIIEDTSEKREMKRTSFFGEDELFLKTLVFSVYGKKIDNDNELFSRQSIIKNHIDSGCLLLDEIFNKSNNDELVFFEKLYAEIQKDDIIDTKETVSPIGIQLGVNESNNQNFSIDLNDTAKYVNPHLAVIGKPGAGKTQFLLKILADVRKSSNFKTNFIFFDYKGDVAQNKDFIIATKATVFHLPHDSIPVNPFILPEYSDNAILLSAREKAESFASIDKHFGPLQKGRLTEIITGGYKERENKKLRYPDFQEIVAIAKRVYENESLKEDTLIQTLKDLAQFHLFWEYGSKDAPFESLSNKTLIIDLHELPVLKQLVVYLVIERFYKEMSVLSDSKTINNYREIRSILVIDEAHNYLSQKNPFLEKIVREGRSKGIAVFFASQSPNDYDQPSFDFRELLQFSFIFQCDGVSMKAVQDLLACKQKIARDLQTEIARLKKFQAVSRSLNDDEEYTKILIDPFYQAYKQGLYE